MKSEKRPEGGGKEGQRITGEENGVFHQGKSGPPILSYQRKEGGEGAEPQSQRRREEKGKLRGVPRQR